MRLSGKHVLGVDFVVCGKTYCTGVLRDSSDSTLIPNFAVCEFGVHFELSEACVFSVTASSLCRTMWLYMFGLYIAEFVLPNVVTNKFGLRVHMQFAVLFRFRHAVVFVS